MTMDLAAPGPVFARSRHEDRERLRHLNGDRHGFVDELSPCDAHHPIAGGDQNAIATTVVFEPVIRRMICTAVDFDDQALASPEEVDLASFDCDVDLGCWEPGFAEERHEAPFRDRACAGG